MSSENLNVISLEIAHKEIVQKAMCIIFKFTSFKIKQARIDMVAVSLFGSKEIDLPEHKR
jgi:hypothetical protein